MSRPKEVQESIENKNDSIDLQDNKYKEQVDRNLSRRGYSTPVESTDMHYKGFTHNPLSVNPQDDIQMYAGEQEGVLYGIGSTAARGAWGVVNKAGALPAMVYGLGKAGVDALSEEDLSGVNNAWMNIIDNEFMRAIDSSEELKAKSLDSHYLNTEEYKNLSAVEKMGTASWWSSVGMDGAEFIVSALATGGLTGEALATANVTKTMTQGVGKSYAWLKSANALKGKALVKELNLKGIDEGMSRLISTGASAVPEAGIEAFYAGKEYNQTAMDTNMKTIATLKGKYSDTFLQSLDEKELQILAKQQNLSYLTDEQIAENRGKVMAGTFNWNMAVILPSNYITFGKVLGKGTTKGTKEGLEASVKEGTKVSKFEQLTKPVVNLAVKGAPESAQEVVQGGIAKYFKENPDNDKDVNLWYS
jgi:hypothetical protein